MIGEGWAFEPSPLIGEGWAFEPSPSMGEGWEGVMRANATEADR